MNVFQCTTRKANNDGGDWVTWFPEFLGDYGYDDLVPCVAQKKYFIPALPGGDGTLRTGERFHFRRGCRNSLQDRIQAVPRGCYEPRHS